MAERAGDDTLDGFDPAEYEEGGVASTTAAHGAELIVEDSTVLPQTASYTSVEQTPMPPRMAVSQDAVLTPEQLEIKRLRDELARASGKKDVLPEIEDLDQPGDEKNILIHFLEDGLTVQGKVAYRGDEMEFAPGSQAYKDTFNRNGFSWLSLRGDERAQRMRWGKVMFAEGPWPGKTYVDGSGSFEPLKNAKPPSVAELEAAEKLRQRRAAPRLAPVV